MKEGTAFSLDLDRSPHIFHSQHSTNEMYEQEQNADSIEKQKKVEEDIEAYRKGIALHKLYDPEGKHKFLLPRVGPLSLNTARIEPDCEPHTRHMSNKAERKVGKKRGKYKCNICGQRKENHICLGERMKDSGCQARMIHESDKISINSGIKILTFTMPKNEWDNVSSQKNECEDSDEIDIDVVAV